MHHNTFEKNIHSDLEYSFLAFVFTSSSRYNIRRTFLEDVILLLKDVIKHISTKFNRI